MKIKRIFILCMVVLLGTSCGVLSKKEQNVNTQKSDKIKKPTKEKISRKKEKDNGKGKEEQRKEQTEITFLDMLITEKGSNYVSEKITYVVYPEISLQTKGYQALDSSLKNLNTILENKVQESIQNMETIVLEEGEYFSLWYDQSGQILRADNIVTSVFLETYNSNMGEGIFVLTGINYDSQTGEILKLSDVIKDKEALSKILEEYIKEDTDLRENMGEYDLSKLYHQNEIDFGIHNNFVWTSDYQGITLHYSVKDEYGYPKGTKHIRISHLDYPEIFEEKFLATPKSYGYPIEIGKPYLVTQNNNENIKVNIKTTYSEEYMENISATLEVDGVDYPLEENRFSYFYDIEAFIFHMENGDNFLYLITKHDNDYQLLSIINLEDPQNMVLLNTNTKISDIYPSNPMHFTLYHVLDTLSTLMATREYQIDDLGNLVPLGDYQIQMERNFITKIPLEFSKLENGNITGIEIIPMGTKIFLISTDGETYTDIQTEDGRMYRIEMDVSDWPRKVNGKDIEECFEGVGFAG